LRLPFEDKKQDPMNWVYDNRIGLFVTIIIFLVTAIVFVTAKIVTQVTETPDTIYIELDFTEQAEVKPEEKPKEKPKAREITDWSSVRNVSSNEAAKEEEKPTPSNHLSDEELRAAAAAAQQGMNDNLKAYEQGLAELNAVGQQKPNADKPSSTTSKDSLRKGNVTVSYSFTDPVRHATYLDKPAYRCEGGGEVVVTAVLNQSGKVISATVESNSGDSCMAQTAKSAALNSTFNIDHDAPKKHEGTIRYIFIPQ
jgi:outer membrane biosynthesis protein TonB